MRTPLLPKFTSSTNTGTNSRHGESSVNMMSMMRKKHKTDMRKDGCSRKTREAARSMKKQKERGF